MVITNLKLANFIYMILFENSARFIILNIKLSSFTLIQNNSYHDLKLNRESSKYLYKILAYKEILEHPKKYGLKIHKKKYMLLPKK